MRITSLPLSGKDCNATKSLAAILGVMFLVELTAPDYGQYFALIPGKTLTIYSHFWTLVTACFYPDSLILGVFNIAALVAVGPKLESRWGGKQLIRYVLMIGSFLTTCMFLWMIFRFATTEETSYIFHQISGFSGVSAALAVALKQRFPTMPLFPAPVSSSQLDEIATAPSSFSGSPLHRLQCQHLPIILIIVAFALDMLSLFEPLDLHHIPAFISGGVFFGWGYLRFFMVDRDTQLVGDLRDEFALVTLLPNYPPLRKGLDKLFNIPYTACLGMGLLQASRRSHDAMLPTSINDHTGNSSSRPGSFIPMHERHNTDNIDSAGNDFNDDNNSNNNGTSSAIKYPTIDAAAERRRQLAIKAIDAKLADFYKNADASRGASAELPTQSNLEDAVVDIAAGDIGNLDEMNVDSLDAELDAVLANQN